ncbi:MAG: rod shape-determining protein MreD [Leptospirales bacterium]|jgi:rod shape-determining protein MreD
MLIEAGLITLGMLISYFLKDIQFLSLTFEFLNTGTIGPDFLLIFVIFFSLFRGEFVGLWVGFFAGILEDGANWVLGGGATGGGFVPIVGIHALVYSITGFALGKLSQVFDRYQTAPIIALVFVSAFLVRFFAWTIQGIVEDFNKNYSLIGPAVFTAIISPIWFSFLGWLYRIKAAEL